MSIIIDIILFAVFMWVFNSIKLYLKMNKLEREVPGLDVTKLSPDSVDRWLQSIEEEKKREKTNKQN